MSVLALVYRIVVAALFVAFVGSSAISYSEKSVRDKARNTVAANASGAPTVEFSLPDMMCEDGCAFAVRDILEKQPGVRDVRVDFEGKTATVAVDEGTFSSERTLAELVDKGFDNSQLLGDSSKSDKASSPDAPVAEKK